MIPILGTTFTGEYEPIEEIHDRVVAYNAATRHRHPDPRRRGERRLRRAVPPAGSGVGLPAAAGEVDQRVGPQVRPHLPGHRLRGLASTDDLPEELIFHVNYLGGDMPTFTLNFSRPGNQIVGPVLQLRPARLRRLHAASWSTSATSPAPVERRSRRWDRSSVVSDGIGDPGAGVQGEGSVQYTVFHVSDQLRMGGWQVPAYTMPEDATDVAVLRIVVREGLGMDLADSLLDALAKAVAHLEEFPPAHPAPAPGFSHT